MRGELRALTVRPWWGHSIAWLGKRIENRSRPIPPALIGQQVAIHAGAWGRPEDWLDQVDKASPWSREQRRERHGSFVPVHKGSIIRKQRASKRVIQERCIVAIATLSGHAINDSWSLPDWADPDALHWWVLEDVQRLVYPVHVERGQLGLWRLDVADAIAVMDALTVPA